MKRQLTTKEMNRNYFLKQRANMLELMRVLSTPLTKKRTEVKNQLAITYGELYYQAGDAQLELMATNLFRLANQLIKKYTK
jgi:hypothetical protein